MINKFRLTRFVSTFCALLFLFAAFNYYTYLNSEGCRRMTDCGYRVGFPFTAYVGGTISHLSNISWPGVLANLAACLAVSIVVGLAAGSIEHRYK